MKNRILMKVMCVMVSMVLAAGSMAYAEPGGDMHHKGGGPDEGRIVDKVLDQLELTSDQKDQLHEQKKEQTVRLMDIRKEMKDQKEELKVLLHAKKTDRAKIDQAIDGISNTSEKMIRARVDGILGIKEVLTPEQFEEFQDLMEETREKHKKMKGKKKRGSGRKGSGKKD